MKPQPPTPPRQHPTPPQPRPPHGTVHLPTLRPAPLQRKHQLTTTVATSCSATLIETRVQGLLLRFIMTRNISSLNKTATARLPTQSNCSSLPGLERRTCPSYVFKHGLFKRNIACSYCSAALISTSFSWSAFV